MNYYFSIKSFCIFFCTNFEIELTLKDFEESRGQIQQLNRYFSMGFLSKAEIGVVNNSHPLKTQNTRC